MAKKRSAKSGKKENVDAEDRPRLLKSWFTDDELQQVRVAAAIAGQTPGEFVRESALQIAAEVEQRYVAKRAKR